MTEQIHLTNEDSYDDGYATDYDSEYEYIGECEHYYYLQKPGPLQRSRGGGRGRGGGKGKAIGQILGAPIKVAGKGTKAGYWAAKKGIGVGKKVATGALKKGMKGAKSAYKFLKKYAKKIGKKVYPKKKKPPKLKL